MKVWVTALMPTKGADVYEGIRTGAALSEREAYLELLDFFDTAEDVDLDESATNEQIIDLLNSHPEVKFWKIEAQEVTTHRVGDLRNKIVEILIGANAAKTLEGVIADEILELVGPTFVLNQEQWEVLQAALDAPPQDLPKLKKLLTGVAPVVADDDGQGFPIHMTADGVIAGVKCGVCESEIRKGERVVEIAPTVFHHEADCLILAPVVDENDPGSEQIPAFVDSLKPGDKVKWNDPDKGLASRVYTIGTIGRFEQLVSITEPDGSKLECLADELEELERIQIYQADWHIKSIDDGTVIASGRVRTRAASVEVAAKLIDMHIRKTRPEADLDDITVVIDPPQVEDEDDEEEEEGGDGDDQPASESA